MGRKIIQENKYGIHVDDADNKCLRLVGIEYWSDFASDPKSMAEIIINAANYAVAPGGLKAGGYYFSDMDRVLWVEPTHPNPDLSR